MILTHKEEFKKIGLGLVLALLAFALAWLIFNMQQSLLISSIVFLVTLWTNEALPLGVVSILPIILFPAFGILTTKATTVNYAHPIIFLFLGGFLLAIAVEKTSLHKYIAAKILSFFPNTPTGIISSLTITSAILSSLLSNTTTAVLLMSIALFISEDIKLKMRFALSVAYGASIGGILTPVGTPPNLILFGIMNDKGMEAIAFFKWMMMVFPLVFVMLIVVSFLLSIGVKDIPIKRDKKLYTLDKEQKKVLYILGGLLLLLLVNSPLQPYWSGLGLSEPIILLSVGVLLFIAPVSVLQWEKDSVKIPYKIMFLFGAGFSIAKAFGATGLADEIASYLLSITHLSPIILLLAVASLITFTTEITSNTALISIMLPVIYAISEQAGINTTLFMMVATVCASYAFMLPIATPPNAIAMSSGAVRVQDMIRYGFILNLVGIALIVLIAEHFWKAVL